MKRKQALMSLILVGGLLALTLTYAADQAKDKSAKAGNVKRLTVNGTAIPAARIDLVVESQLAQGRQAGPELEKNVRENLIALELVSQQAVHSGLDKNPKIQAQIDLAREQILARAMQEQYARNNPIKDDVLKAEYDRMKAELGDTEYLAEHILVKDEKEANEILAQLKKGGDFEAIAKQKSLDTGSRDKGGKLEWATPVSFDKAFSDAMVKLKKGQTTDIPVKTQYGYHIIRLMDVRPLQAPPFDSVKDRIAQAKEQEAFAKMVQDLRSKARIEEK